MGRLLRDAISMMGLRSKAELRHVRDCMNCDLFPVDDGSYFCAEFRQKYLGEEPPAPPTEEDLKRNAIIQELWSAEISEYARRATGMLRINQENTVYFHDPRDE